MAPEIQKLEDSIKKVHKVAFTPKYKENFHTRLSREAFIALAKKVIEKIGWDLIYYDDFAVEAHRKNEWGNVTESITMTYDHHSVKIQSKSLGNQMWDVGRNSKRVKLFQLVLDQLESELSPEEIQYFEEKQKSEFEMSDYEIPETLPPPNRFKRPNLPIVVIIAVIAALGIGYTLGASFAHGFYLIGVFDVAIGFVLGLVMVEAFKLASYTNYANLRWIYIGGVALMFLSSQYFMFQIRMEQFPTVRLDFIEFMQLRLAHGLEIKGLNTGWIGLVISWLILVLVSYWIGIYRIGIGMVKFQLNRVPVEVIDFAVYYLVKGKTEDQVRDQLAKKGWTQAEYQNLVFEAVGALGDLQQMRRSE
ncbi:MAG: hypothetical protein Crog4KO_22980 [Crocinitomicaceae bacterium]